MQVFGLVANSDDPQVDCHRNQPIEVSGLQVAYRNEFEASSLFAPPLLTYRLAATGELPAPPRPTGIARHYQTFSDAIALICERFWQPSNFLTSHIDPASRDG